jgi:hypothetical protein
MGIKIQGQWCAWRCLGGNSGTQSRCQGCPLHPSAKHGHCRLEIDLQAASTVLGGSPCVVMPAREGGSHALRVKMASHLRPRRGRAPVPGHSHPDVLPSALPHPISFRSATDRSSVLARTCPSPLRACRPTCSIPKSDQKCQSGHVDSIAHTDNRCGHRRYKWWWIERSVESYSTLVMLMWEIQRSL